MDSFPVRISAGPASARRIVNGTVIVDALDGYVLLSSLVPGGDRTPDAFLRFRKFLRARGVGLDAGQGVFVRGDGTRFHPRLLPEFLDKFGRPGDLATDATRLGALVATWSVECDRIHAAEHEQRVVVGRSAGEHGLVYGEHVAREAAEATCALLLPGSLRASDALARVGFAPGPGGIRMALARARSSFAIQTESSNGIVDTIVRETVIHALSRYG